MTGLIGCSCGDGDGGRGHGSGGSGSSGGSGGAGVLLFGPDKGRTVRYCTCFRDFAVVGGREGGLTKMWVVPFDEVQAVLLIQY